MKKAIFAILFFCLVLTGFAAEPAVASMVLKVDFNQVVNGAELIFQGRVVSKETRPSPLSGKPFTYFTFAVIDVIKGSYERPTIEIGYMGGKLGEFTLEISDMRMPEVDEGGIYFVETLSEEQIHPLFGWQQGHYLVITSRQTGIDTVVPVEQEVLKKRPTRAARPLTLKDFKQNIRNAMGETK